ncbi:hypothetical protein BLOT_004652 [Blomia tropicalis]|nr:hypothetical protein BLOT_004652 [Blomia tropicalis]
MHIIIIINIIPIVKPLMSMFRNIRKEHLSARSSFALTIITTTVIDRHRYNQCPIEHCHVHDR